MILRWLASRKKRRRPPATGPVWDERLITRERALELAGTWEIYLEDLGTGKIYIRCSDCNGSCGEWYRFTGTTVEDQLSGVLRHLVMAHEVSLSGAGRG